MSGGVTNSAPNPKILPTVNDFGALRQCQLVEIMAAAAMATASFRLASQDSLYSSACAVCHVGEMKMSEQDLLIRERVLRDYKDCQKACENSCKDLSTLL